jgi:hypothetical protein
VSRGYCKYQRGGDDEGEKEKRTAHVASVC